MIDLVASLPHYLDHLRPVWAALPPETRGRAYVGPQLDDRAVATLGDVRPILKLTEGAGPVLVAGFDDLRHVHQRPVVMMEHGCGQSYGGDDASAVNPAYAGGQGRHGVIAFLHPNEYAAARDRAAYPDAMVRVVGSPRLAQLQVLASPRPPKGKPTLAFAFHWDCNLTLESMSGWRHWEGAFEDICRSGRYEVLAHAHPRSFRDMAPAFEAAGAEPVGSFEEILTRAHVLAADNTSVMYEFAALRGPVVVLDAPWYRPDVDHGLRFWDAANIGPRILDPLALELSIESALTERPWPGAADIIDRVFPPTENPAQVAADAAVEAVKAWTGGNLRSASPYPRTAPLPG